MDQAVRAGEHTCQDVVGERLGSPARLVFVEEIRRTLGEVDGAHAAESAQDEAGVPYGEAHPEASIGGAEEGPEVAHQQTVAAAAQNA